MQCAKGNSRPVPAGRPLISNCREAAVDEAACAWRFEAAALRENEDVKEFYLGVSQAGRKSFRQAKFYKRRKRWLA